MDKLADPDLCEFGKGNMIVFLSSLAQQADVRGIDPRVKIVLLPRVPQVDVPKQLLEVLSGDEVAYFGPEAIVPDKSLYNLAWEQIHSGYELIVPFRDHRSEPIFYTNMFFGKVKPLREVLHRWKVGLTDDWYWEAFEQAVYSFPLAFWPVPATWWEEKGLYEGTAVVIPCYNHEWCVADAVKSAEKADQIIVVDDGSGGDILSALESVVSSKLFVIRQENGGLPAARNAGIRASTMRYVVSLDADDKLGSNFLAETVKACDPFTWTYTNVAFFGDVEREINVRVTEKSICDMQPAHPAVLFDKSAWLFVGGYDETIGGFESWDYHARLWQAGWVPRKAKGKVFYRKRKGQGMLAQVLENRTHYLAELARRSPAFFKNLRGVT